MTSSARAFESSHRDSKPPYWSTLEVAEPTETFHAAGHHNRTLLSARLAGQGRYPTPRTLVMLLESGTQTSASLRRQVWVPRYLKVLLEISPALPSPASWLRPSGGTAVSVSTSHKLAISGRARLRDEFSSRYRWAKRKTRCLAVRASVRTKVT